MLTLEEESKKKKCGWEEENSYAHLFISFGPAVAKAVALRALVHSDEKVEPDIDASVVLASEEITDAVFVSK